MYQLQTQIDPLAHFADRIARSLGAMDVTFPETGPGRGGSFLSGSAHRPTVVFRKGQLDRRRAISEDTFLAAAPTLLVLLGDMGIDASPGRVQQPPLR